MHVLNRKEDKLCYKIKTSKEETGQLRDSNRIEKENESGRKT